MKLFKLATFMLVSGMLTACSSSSYKTDYECKAADGIAPCLKTQDVDNLQPVEGKEPGKKTTSTKPAVLVPDDSKPYGVPATITLPTRTQDVTKRVWFAPRNDNESDLAYGPQYVWFVERGHWSTL